MRATLIVIRRIATAMLMASAMAGGAMAAEPAQYPVPVTVIYPGDLIKEEMIVDRPFPMNMPGLAAFASERPMAVGRIARRALMPGQMIPLNALEEQKLVTRGNVVKVVMEDGGLTIITYGSSLQSGTPGALIQLRNLDTGVTIRGIVQPDGSVRIQNG